MTGRRVGALLTAGVVVIVFAMWVASQRHLEGATTAGDLVLPDLERNVNTIDEITLRKGDGAHVTLKKDATGWSVSERGWPADGDRVRKLLLDLGALNIVEEKTRLPANYPQLGVEDVNSPKATGTRIELRSPAGHSWALIVGKSSSAKAGFVRVATAPQSLLAAPLLTVDAEPKGWLDHTFIDLPTDRVRQVEERPAEGPSFSVSREKKEQTNFSVTPLPKGRELSYAGAADPIASALSSLNLDDVAKAGNPADSKAAHAMYRTFDGLEVDLTGRKDGSRSLVRLNAHSTSKDTEAEASKLNARLGGWEVELPDYKYTAIFRPLDELLKKPPEPAKKTAKTPAKTPANTPASATAGKSEKSSPPDKSSPAAANTETSK